MSKSGVELAAYATAKIGTPYFYGSKMQKLTESLMSSMHKAYPSTVTDSYIAKARQKGMVGKICVDCSGLVGSYRGKQIGSSQLYSSASIRIPIENVDSAPIGSVLWKQGHVGIKVSDTECVEAKGINYGTIRSKIKDTQWKYCLLFSDIEYDGLGAPGNAKKDNPYKEPTRNIHKGHHGNDVRWVQFELQEAGYDLDCDGVAGAITDACIRDFQKSSKLKVDGIVGSATRKALKQN